MGLKMIFYLTNVNNAVSLSQPSVCIGGGLHAPSFRTALSKPRNLSYFLLKIRSRPKKGENRPRLWTERLDSWVSKIARLGEDTTQKTTNYKFLLATVSTFSSYDPPKTPSPRFTALSKPRNLSYFPLKIRSRRKKGENRPRLRTERLGSWVSKIVRLGEDTTQKTTTNFCSQMYWPSRVTALQKHRHPGSLWE